MSLNVAQSSADLESRWSFSTWQRLFECMRIKNTRRAVANSNGNTTTAWKAEAQTARHAAASREYTLAFTTTHSARICRLLGQKNAVALAATPRSLKRSLPHRVSTWSRHVMVSRRLYKANAPPRAHFQALAEAGDEPRRTLESATPMASLLGSTIQRVDSRGKAENWRLTTQL